MAIKKKAGGDSAESDTTIVLELTQASTYVHFASGLVFKKGGQYRFAADDARELMQLHDELGVPRFRIYRKPKVKVMVLDDDEAVQADKGVVTLPNNMKKGRENEKVDARENEAWVDPAPKKPMKVVESVEPAQEDEGTVDSDEIDTGAGVEV